MVLAQAVPSQAVPILCTQAVPILCTIGGRVRRERAKHIDIRKHFAHEVIQHGEMRLVRVPTSSQLADILTKGLHYPHWQACIEGILSKKVKST
jgi:hypothetical protein